MDEAARNQLLADLKLSLQITWYDDDTDRSVLTWMDNGVAYLNSKLGEAGDYASPGFPRTLLFEYVRYARDAALDVFENNYLSLILAMQNERKVSAFETVLRAAEGVGPYEAAGGAAGDS